MKHQIQRTVLTVLVLVGGMVFLNSLHPAQLAALPAPYVAVTAPGDICDLPDGTTTGVIATDNQTCCPKKGLNGDGSVNPIQCLYAKYINPAIAALSAIVGVAVIVAIVYGAIEYITSGGDPQRTAAGKKRIIEALIGLAAFLLLYTFLQFLIPGGISTP